MAKKTIWIVVADGARARFFQNSGEGTGLESAMAQDLVADKRKSGDIGSDRPGRTFDSAGQGRHGMEPHSDPHRQEEFEFARDVADFLEDHRIKKSYDELVLIAAPRMLGDLRKAVNANVARMVSHEVDKDLSKLSVHELPARLEGLVNL